MTPPILEFQNVQVRAESRILLDIPSFQLDAGEHLSLIGPNGSGKTTFLHLAACLRCTTFGHVAFRGQVVTARNAASLRRHVAIVFQDPLLFSVNVLQNVAAGLRFQGINRAEAHHRALEFLTLFGVAHLANRRPHGLSGGEAARVALARAFATDPDLMLLDEPFSALDAETRSALLPELRERLMDRGAAAILVTHDSSEAFFFAPRLALLDAGRVIADGDIHDLAMHPPTRRIAELLGVENVISGRLKACVNGLANVEIAPGLSLHAAYSGALVPGTEVEITVPAAMMHLLQATGSPPDGWNVISGRVTWVVRQPGWDLITLRAAGLTIRVRQLWTATGTQWQEGDVVVASFPPESAWIIPESAIR